MLASGPNQQGLTLVELMVGLVVGLILTAGVLKIYITNMNANRSNLQISMLNQELRSMLHLVEKDVRRAGFWAGVPGTDDMSTNPFLAEPNDLVVSEKAAEIANSCITYSYDLDKDKLVDVGPIATSAPFDADPYDLGGMEQFGFRLNGTSVQMRTGLLTATETDIDCDSGTWIRISDNNTEVTQMDFQLTTQYLNVTNGAACSPSTTNCCNSGDACQLIRDLNITITGRLANDPAVIKTVSALTRIRNDKYIVMP